MKARTLLFLIAAFTAVVLAFVGSTMVSQRAAREVRDLSLRISRDTAPGIESMATLRAEVRRVQTLVRGAGEQAGADLDKQIADARHQLDNAQLRFQALPHFSPEERAIFPRLVANMRAFDEAVERALERARSGRGATPVRELLPYGDAAAKAAQEILDVDAREAEQMAARIETVHERADKLALQLDAVSAILAAIAAAMAVRAVRHMVRLQEENRQLMERKAAELEQFAGRVAHDVLSPLSSVSLALSLVQKTSGQAAQNAAARGMTSLSRVRNVVDALLDFARAGAQPEPGAVAPVREAVAGLEDEIRPAALAENVELVVEPDPVPDCAVACAPGVLAVLLTNLVRNSLKYMGDSAVRRVHLGVRARRNVVVFEIADSGPGVPEELGERIFEAYVRGKRTAAKKSGIGLGLATVKRLVVAHGGTVGVRRSHLGGALFWFELPRAEGECDPLSVRSTENPAHPA
ncbi:MAG: ATP-binding protein [Myxococcales bacterium]